MADEVVLVRIGTRDLAGEKCVIIARSEVPPVPLGLKGEQCKIDPQEIIYDHDGPEGCFRWRVRADEITAFIEYDKAGLEQSQTKGLLADTMKRLWCTDG